MIIVHHLEHSRSQRVLFLLEEMGLEYEIKHYKRDPRTNLAPAELKAAHPLGKSPMIEDDGKMIPETGAIIEYLVYKYGEGKWSPEPGSDDWMHYSYWMHAAEGSIAPLLVMKLIFSKITQPPVPFFVRPITKKVSQQINRSYIGPSLKGLMDLMEQQLTDTQWFAGNEFSAVDAMMSFAAEGVAVRGSLGDRYPKIQAFLDAVHSRPAFKRALERGGPYDLMS